MQTVTRLSGSAIASTCEHMINNERGKRPASECRRIDPVSVEVVENAFSTRCSAFFKVDQPGRFAGACGALTCGAGQSRFRRLDTKHQRREIRQRDGKSGLGPISEINVLFDAPKQETRAYLRVIDLGLAMR